jgi:hypothetical protein
MSNSLKLYAPKYTLAERVERFAAISKTLVSAYSKMNYPAACGGVSKPQYFFDNTNAPRGGECTLSDSTCYTKQELFMSL